MPEITRDQVEHLARLAHIRMTDEELDTMSGERVTNAFLVPAVLQMLVAVPGAAERDWSALRSMAYGASPITAGALRQAAHERDAREINRTKAFTRIGMGRCQGRVCGEAAAELLARACGSDLERVGRLRGQAPVKPIPIMVRSAA